MLDLLHLGPETSDSIHRVRMYLHFAFQHPPDSDLRRMWMTCAYSEHFGVCPLCVPASRQDAREFRDWAVQWKTAKSRWDALPENVRRKCLTPKCGNNQDEQNQRLMQVAGVTYCTQVRLQHETVRLGNWI